MLIRLPGNRIINLQRVNQITYSSDLSEVTVFWATGDCELYLVGKDAIALIHAIDTLNDHRKQQLIDVQQFIDPFVDAGRSWSYPEKSSPWE